ncbi:metal ABC transporter permease [Leucobacter luti]|uniref:ABC-type Mn2+/Zn2+ transport system permease subunit n=1 Tax=Leucobacter luti TaxID=340320 RepID=A0A4Q7U2N9_9MICO|nr:metal ABC transporter permease [Leucobacter luti]MBL3699390.1 metal ABC transporter permease [Leucobacter luti]RZT66900.1 ABC-type Mn2+/Zn2+ transport system permease subunit [Leucobacter luti]
MSYFTLAAIELSLLGLLAGLAGTLIVLRRRSFFAVALSHATFPGGVVFAIAGLNLLLGQALFALVLVLLMTLLGKVPGQGRQVTSGVVLSFGFALGTLLASLNPGLGIPVEALLVGSPLSVSGGDVAATGAVLVLALGVLALTRRRILFHTFDPVGFAAAGFKSWPVELIVTGVIAAAVVVAMPAVGAILGVAVIIGPAATARVLTSRLALIPPLAAGIGVLGGLVGLWVSREFAIAAGGAVGLVIAGLFILAVVARAIADRVGHRSGEFATVGGKTPAREG